MDDKKAAKILIALLDKYDLNKEEKKALKSAIGILSWTYLHKNSLKIKKARLKKQTEWQ